MTETTVGRATAPVPMADELTRPYWEGASRQQLVIERCVACRAFHHPPTSRCFACGSEEMSFEPVSGVGRIDTYTITHDARTPAFTARQPYAVVWVELVEQPGLLVIANMPDTSMEDVEIGRSVQVCFEEISEGVWLPQFRILDTAADSD